MKKRIGLHVAIASILVLVASASFAWEVHWFNEDEIYDRNGDLIPLGSTDRHRNCLHHEKLDHTQCCRWLVLGVIPKYRWSPSPERWRIHLYAHF